MKTAQNMDQLLARKSEFASRIAAQPEVSARLHELQRWQAERLARTYRDLHRNPRYASAVDFFLSELYGPRDSTSRDRDVERAWRYLKRGLPAAPLAALERAIELEVLTAELDHATAAALASTGIGKAEYARAYRAVGQREARQHQIDLVIGAGESLDRAVRHAWVGPLLRAAHGPSHAAGFGVLQDFIERGYEAFRHMGSAKTLLAAIRERETALMEALFSGRDEEDADE
jgi:hypothetical protein